MANNPKDSTPRLALGAAGVTLQTATPGTPWRLIVLMAVTQVIVFVVSTQYLAYKLAYQPLLGEPLFTVLGHSVYAPWSWGLWSLKFWAIAGFRAFAFPLVMIQVSWLLGLVGYIYFSGANKPKSITSSTLHGSAHWATAKEIAQTGLLDMTFDIEPLGGAPAPAKFFTKVRSKFSGLKQKLVSIIWID